MQRVAERTDPERMRKKGNAFYGAVNSGIGTTEARQTCKEANN